MLEELNLEEMISIDGGHEGAAYEYGQLAGHLCRTLVMCFFHI